MRILFLIETNKLTKKKPELTRVLKLKSTKKIKTVKGEKKMKRKRDDFQETMLSKEINLITQYI